MYIVTCDSSALFLHFNTNTRLKQVIIKPTVLPEPLYSKAAVKRGNLSNIFKASEGLSWWHGSVVRSTEDSFEEPRI